MILSSSNDKAFQNHNRNLYRLDIPQSSLSSASEVHRKKSNPEYTCSNRKKSIESKAAFISAAYFSNLTVCPTAAYSKEMIPFPYYPYPYVNYESKDNAPTQTFTPYFVPPGMMPSFHPPSSAIDTPTQNGNTSSTSAPMPMYNSVPRPAFLAGIQVPTEPPQFGPGPPIVTGERLKGPRGCNLFVFHLPNEITNWDLYLLFRRFGTILSVHIMVNKSTGLSKGYGFVSFAFAEDATAAIELMDGFRLGKKRLKVQLKRLQDDCSDEEGNWMDRPDGESNGNSSSTDNTLSMSPGISRRMRKVFSSTSLDGGVNPDIAIELEHEEIGSPVKDMADAPPTGYKSKNPSLYTKTNNIPPRT